MLERGCKRILGGPDGVKGWSERDAEDGVGDFLGGTISKGFINSSVTFS